MRKFCAVSTALATLALFTAALSACSPVYNWRETPLDGTELVGMLPCKPDKGSRKVPLAGRVVDMHMTGCDADGTTFAIARANLKDPLEVPAVLAQWRAATLTNMGAATATNGALMFAETPLATTASAHMPPLILVSAVGKRQDGSPVTLQGVWFSRGTQVIHAAIYFNADATKAPEATSKYQDASEAFFSGLKFP